MALFVGLLRIDRRVGDFMNGPSSLLLKVLKQDTQYKFDTPWVCERPSWPHHPHPKKTHLTTVPDKNCTHSKKDLKSHAWKKKMLSKYESWNIEHDWGKREQLSTFNTNISKRKLLLYIQPRRHTAKPQQFSAANTGDPKLLQNSPMSGNSLRWWRGNPCIQC